MSELMAQSSKLLNYTLLGEFSVNEAQWFLKQVPALDTLTAKNSVNLYKIQYETQAPDGATTNASGLVAMPVAPKQKVGIVSFFHGTRVARNDAPSNLPIKDFIYPAIFSSSGGYMLVMPDYLGYGDNTLPVHPYVHAQSLASTSIDMLMAAKEMASQLNYPINDTLFLAGYSEGGFTTMVTFEELLKHHPEIPVTAAAPGSAPYDWNETMRFITLQPGPRSSAYVAYLLYSMQTWFEFWPGFDAIYKQPYETIIPNLFDGNHDFADILGALPSDPRDLVQSEFFDAIINGTDNNTETLRANFNHYDFKATSPLLLVGSKGDGDVPFHGAEIAYKQLKQLSDKVYIKSVSDVLDHIQAAPFVIKEQLAFFQQYDSEEKKTA
jgi:hypothetical protein